MFADITRVARVAGAAALALAAGAAGGCGGDAPAAAAPPAPTVEVARPVVDEVIEWDEYTGRLAAVDAVDIRARVGGYLDAIHFRDGQLVNRGDVLFTIDPRPYQAALDAAAGDAGQLASRLELARNDLSRAERLIKTRAISQEDYDTRGKEAQAADAALKAAQARVERAKLDLDWTKVYAPMAGRVARHNVSVGNLISGGTADSTVLTNIVSLDPIHCYFDVDEQAYLKYSRLDKAGLRRSSRDQANPVRVRLLDETDFTREGKMDYVENQIDALTGTLRGRALLPNADLGLLPGVFVKLQLPGSGLYKAVMVPDEAVGADQSDRFVLVVDEKNLVQQRVVTPGRLVDGLRVIRAGLNGDESVIVSGVQLVRPGTAVTPKAVPVARASATRPATRPAADAPATQPVALNRGVRP